GKQRAAELAQRLTELQADLARQEKLGLDANDSLARLTDEERALEAESAGAATGLASARDELDKAEAALAGVEAEHAAAQASLSDITARRGASERSLKEARERAA